MFKSGFFDAQILPSGMYDREYDSNDFSQCFDCFISDGVVGKNKEVSEAFKVFFDEPDSNKVRTKPGVAWIGGRWCTQDAEQEFEILMPAQVGKKRIDGIFIRCDYDAREFSLVTKSSQEFDVNTSAEDYPFPAPQNNQNVKEIVLAYIIVTQESDTISECTITDERVFAQTKLNDWALGGLTIVKCTQAQYDALSEHPVDTMYVIVGEQL